MRRSEEERTALRARINELESHNHEILNAAKWLRVQNSELERKADLRKPEVENAIDARNAAIRKWRRAKMVIRDLLDERRVNYDIETSFTLADWFDIRYRCVSFLD
jgi:predicted nuclease with TOPRIM domain